MNIFALIANIINKLLSFSLLPDILPGKTETTIETDSDKRDTEEFKSIGETNKGRCLLSRPENVNPNARFHSTGSAAWVNQWQGTAMAGQHGGTDYLGPQGTKVYAPWPMTIIAIGHYSDSGRFGDYVIGTPAHDTSLEFYTGHLQNVRVSTGDVLACGDEIGEMNVYNHTHIQIKRNGQVIDPESVLT